MTYGEIKRMYANAGLTKSPRAFFDIDGAIPVDMNGRELPRAVSELLSNDYDSTFKHAFYRDGTIYVSSDDENYQCAVSVVRNGVQMHLWEFWWNSCRLSEFLSEGGRECS